MEAGYDYLNRAIEQDRTLSVQDLRLIRRDFARLQGQVELLSRKYYSALCTKCGYMRPATEIEKENEKLEENRVDLCVMLKEWQALVHSVRLKQINEETSQLLEKNMRPSALPAEEEKP